MDDRKTRFGRRVGVEHVLGIFDATYTPLSPRWENKWGRYNVGTIIVEFTYFLRSRLDTRKWEQNPSLPRGSYAIAVTETDVILSRWRRVRARYPAATAFGLVSYRSVDDPWVEISGDRFWVYGANMDEALRLRKAVTSAPVTES